MDTQKIETDDLVIGAGATGRVACVPMDLGDAAFAPLALTNRYLTGEALHVNGDGSPS